MCGRWAPCLHSTGAWSPLPYLYLSLSVCLSVCLFVCLCVSVCPSVCCCSRFLHWTICLNACAAMTSLISLQSCISLQRALTFIINVLLLLNGLVLSHFLSIQKNVKKCALQFLFRDLTWPRVTVETKIWSSISGGGSGRGGSVAVVVVVVVVVVVYAMFYGFFCFFLFFFLLFPFTTKIPDNRSRERLNGFSWNFYQTIAGKMEFCVAVPKWGLGPQIFFWGLKTTHCALGGDAWRVTEN